jgi:hypothetical protein
MFVVHAVVQCGEDRCWHGNTANGAQSGHCTYVRFIGASPGIVRCDLFDKELSTVPGTGAPLRCPACQAAEGSPAVAKQDCLIPRL